MKKYLFIILAGLTFISCNVPSYTLMGFYEISYSSKPVLQYNNTFITLINSSETRELGGADQSITVYTFFFDDNEKLLKSHIDKLSADDMVTLNVAEIIGPLDSLKAMKMTGVFKCIALDSKSQLLSVLVGFQTKQYYIDNELVASSESGLFATTQKVAPENVIKMSKVLQ